jgi:hypothetical protein
VAEDADALGDVGPQQLDAAELRRPAVELGRRRRHLGEEVVAHSGEEGVLVGEAGVEDPDRAPGPLDDVADAGPVEAVLGEQLPPGKKEALELGLAAGLLRCGAVRLGEHECEF